MADEDHGAAVADVVAALRVHFRHQRTGGVEHAQLAFGRLIDDLFRHTVRAEDGDGVRRHLGEVLDEAGAARFERIDHPLVVHDLVAHVDRRPVFIERAFDDLDRAHDAGAKPARLGQNNLHLPPPFSFPFPAAAPFAAARRRRCLSASTSMSAGCNSGT